MNQTFTHCPKCEHTSLVKAGFDNGRQRYKRKGCHHYFFVHRHSLHKSDDTKQMAINTYLEVLDSRPVDRVLTSVMALCINRLNSLEGTSN